MVEDNREGEVRFFGSTRQIIACDRLLTTTIATTPPMLRLFDYRVYHPVLSGHPLGALIPEELGLTMRTTQWHRPPSRVDVHRAPSRAGWHVFLLLARDDHNHVPRDILPLAWDNHAVLPLMWRIMLSSLSRGTSTCTAISHGRRTSSSILRVCCVSLPFPRHGAPLLPVFAIKRRR